MTPPAAGDVSAAQARRNRFAGVGTPPRLLQAPFDARPDCEPHAGFLAGRAGTIGISGSP